MSILVTGSNSFVGKFLVTYLASLNFNIIAAWNINKPDFTHLPEDKRLRIKTIQLDLNRQSIHKLIPENINSIIHLAGISLPIKSSFEFVESNIIPINNLVNFAHAFEVKKFIFLSSISVYGDVIDNIVTEHTALQNPDMYGTSKYLSEVILKDSGLNTVSIRIPGVLGRTAHRHLLSNILKLSLAGDKIQIFNPNSPFNNAIHIADLSKFISLLLDFDWVGNHAAPIAASGQCAIGEIIRVIIELCNSKSEIEILRSDRKSFLISSKYFIDQFGYRPNDITEIVRQYVIESL